MLRLFLFAVGILIIPLSPISAAPVVYTDFSAFQAAGGAGVTLDFENVTLGEGDSQSAATTDFSGFPGSPSFDSGFIGNPDNPNPGVANFFGGDFFATSPENVLSPELQSSPNGTVTVSFDTPVTSVGAFFLDVEGGFTNTGFDIDGNGTVDIGFTSNQGDESQSFLGFILMPGDAPLSEVGIVLGTGTGDGIGLDDLSYSVVPEPASLAIFGLATLAGGAYLRRRKQAVA